MNFVKLLAIIHGVCRTGARPAKYRRAVSLHGTVRNGMTGGEARGGLPRAATSS